MMPPSPALLLFAIAATAAALPAMLAFGISRATRRRARWDKRRRVLRLARLLSAHLRGRIPDAVLLAAVQDAPASEFWAALESRALRSTPADRRRLARALERNRHSAAERRTLLVDSPLRCELAARRLGLLPTRASRRALRSTLGAGPDIVALTAARALARQGDVRTLEWILEHPERLGRRSPAEWRSLLQAFGRRALPLLAAELEYGASDPRVVRAALEALGHGRYLVATPIVERALGHREVEVRIAAARSLGLMRAEPCSDALVRALGDSAWAVRAQAARALGRIGIAAAVAPLAASLTDRDWWVRRHAAYALVRLGEGGVRALEEASSRSPDRYARDIAEEALASLRRGA